MALMHPWTAGDGVGDVAVGRTDVLADAGEAVGGVVGVVDFALRGDFTDQAFQQVVLPGDGAAGGHAGAVQADGGVAAGSVHDLGQAVATVPGEFDRTTFRDLGDLTPIPHAARSLCGTGGHAPLLALDPCARFSRA